MDAKPCTHVKKIHTLVRNAISEREREREGTDRNLRSVKGKW